MRLPLVRDFIATCCGQPGGGFGLVRPRSEVASRRNVVARSSRTSCAASSESPVRSSIALAVVALPR